MALSYLVMDNGCNIPIGTTFPTNSCNILLTGFDELGANYPIPPNAETWTSNNPSVAAPLVPTDGLIMGYSDGVAIITATYLGKSVSKSVTVGTGIQIQPPKAAAPGGASPMIVVAAVVFLGFLGIVMLKKK